MQLTNKERSQLLKKIWSLSSEDSEELFDKIAEVAKEYYEKGTDFGKNLYDLAEEYSSIGSVHHNKMKIFIDRILERAIVRLTGKDLFGIFLNGVKFNGQDTR